MNTIDKLYDIAVGLHFVCVCVCVIASGSGRRVGDGGEY